MLTALDIVIRTIESKNSLAPIRYWGYILMTVCALEGKIKNNLNCVSLVRTHRDLSKSGIDQNDFNEYPKVLERDLDVSSIKNRINFPNPLSDFVIKHLEIDFMSSTEIIYGLFTNNISYNVFDKLKLYFPSYNKSEKNQIKKIKKLIYN